MTLAPNATALDVLAHLRSLRSDAAIEGMKRFGIETETALGISNPALRAIARQIRRDQPRAGELWASGLREARLLAAFTGDPKVMTADVARKWATDFSSWEVVHSVADLFGEAGLQQPLIEEFARDDREFVRRAAFSMIAWSAVHLKKVPDSTILAWLPLIENHAGDKRNFVKKAVNWALRQIGKRSVACHGPALALAEILANSPNASKRWIGKDAVRELTSEKVLAKFGL